MAKLIQDNNGNWEIIVAWGEEDIIQQAEDDGVNLTPAQVHRVMMVIVRSHDACIGINWDVISSAIDYVLGEMGEGEGHSEKTGQAQGSNQS